MKVEKLEVISLADDEIHAQRTITPYPKLTIEVRDETIHRFLRATLIKGDEIRRLFHFLIPLVIKLLEGKQKYYQEIIPENKESIKRAIEREQTRVLYFKDVSFWGGKKHLTLEEAKAKLKEQEQKLREIQTELSLLSKLRKETEANP